jgi:hypothetical protein
MRARITNIRTLADLRDYVNQTLCSHHQLELGAFPLTERWLTRSGKPCGLFFCLHGPRSVKFSAIWEMQHNTVLFYTATGERFLRTQLASAPRLDMAAA